MRALGVALMMGGWDKPEKLQSRTSKPLQAHSRRAQSERRRVHHVCPYEDREKRLYDSALKH
jgi:Txe/YoeB family toxin of Txe-Axe toxin-antitoxin module